MYNLTLRRVRATIVAVGKQRVLHKLSVCICSRKYSACNAHAPYCHLWPAALYGSFPNYLINGTIFEKKSYSAQNVGFDFLYNFCLKLLKPTGHVMHHQQFNIQQLYVLPTLYLCVLYLSENKQRLVPLTA